MIFGVSNLGWNSDQNKHYFDLMIENGFSYIESVPDKISNNVNIQAIQSIFYKTNIKSFNEIDSCINRFNKLINMCQNTNIETIVVGSPNMRVGKKSNLLSILKEVDAIADDISICIEPNAKQYGGEYFFSLEEIIEEIYLFKNVSTMLDTGNAIMQGNNIFDQFEKYSEYIDHIHFSAAHNKPIVDYGIYREFASFLRSKYKKKITYEFLEQESIAAHIKIFSSNIIKGLS